MKQMNQFLNLYHQYNKQCDFIIVYIKEAHAEDRWKLNGNEQINYHKTLNQRFDAFKLMFNNIFNLINNDDDCNVNSIEQIQKIKFIIDSMNWFKNLDYVFNAYPERMIAVKNNRIVHKFSGPGPVSTVINGEYDMNELQKYLNKYFN
eukprot:180362_1